MGTELHNVPRPRFAGRGLSEGQLAACGRNRHASEVLETMSHPCLPHQTGVIHPHPTLSAIKGEGKEAPHDFLKSQLFIEAFGSSNRTVEQRLKVQRLPLADRFPDELLSVALLSASDTLEVRLGVLSAVAVLVFRAGDDEGPSASAFRDLNSPDISVSEKLISGTPRPRLKANEATIRTCRRFLCFISRPRMNEWSDGPYDTNRMP